MTPTTQALPPLGLQLYTVRDALTQDFEGVVRQVAAMGYAGVETAGIFGASPESAKKLFDSLGLTVTSSHTGLPLGDQKNQVIETVLAVGSPRIVISFGPDEFKTEAKIAATCELLNEAATVAAKHGITVGYHNHWWEFEPAAAPATEPVWRIMERHLKPEVFWEVDTYWVTTAGADPAQAVATLGRRAPLLHIKDGPAKQGVPMTAVGAGVVNFPAIAQAGGDKAEWWIVEMDECATDMLTAVKESYQFLTGKGLARGND